MSLERTVIYSYSQELQTYRFGGTVTDILVQKPLKIVHEALNVC
jgi:hypothetical protein